PVAASSSAVISAIVPPSVVAVNTGSPNIRYTRRVLKLPDASGVRQLRPRGTGRAHPSTDPGRGPTGGGGSRLRRHDDGRHRGGGPRLARDGLQGLRQQARAGQTGVRRGARRRRGAGTAP